MPITIAGGVTISGGVTFLGPESSSINSFTYQSNSGNNAAFLTTLTKTLSIGTAPTAEQKRIIYLGVGGVATNADTTISSATCNGISMTQVLRSRLGGTGMAEATIYRLEVNSGTTATFVITKTGSGPISAGFFVYSLIANSSATVIDYDTATDVDDPINLSIDTPSTLSYILGVAMCRNRTSWTWTGLTEDVDFDVDTTDVLSGASSSFSTAQTNYSITADTGNTGNQVAGCAVTISF
jgi:hypothetical protein